MKKVSFIILLCVLGLNLLAQKSTEKLIKVKTSDVSLILKKDNQNQLKHLYFGDSFEGEDLMIGTRGIVTRPDIADIENIPDGYLTYGGRTVLSPALKITFPDGVQTTQLEIIGYSQKNIEDNIIQTLISMKDKLYNVYVDIIFNAYQKENIITQKVSVVNKEKKTIKLESVHSSYMPVNAQTYYLTHFSGGWSNEMNLTENKIVPGIQLIESKKGVRTTLHSNPSFILSLNQPALPYAGDVVIGALAWSGSYQISFELDEENRLNILSGINPFASTYNLKSNTGFTTPEMIWAYSNNGYNKASRNLHDWSRKYAISGGDKINQIVLNSWEGVQFRFDEKALTKMMDDAAGLGVEVFVLDDGWFGNSYPRNSPKAGLGDWQVNKEKLPNGLDYLAKYAIGKGMRFGIWMEPEMLNPDSDLAKKHPEWIVKSKGREIPAIRQQWLLDLSNPKVQDFVFETVSGILSSSGHITYIKWDANRHVESFGSTYLSEENQSHFWIDYTNGLYSVYNRIKERYPHIEIQLCASGGGRVDYGALKYHNELWTSDNTDPYSRIFIQYSTSLICPPKAMASHVTISPNKQTGNESSLKFRFDVAMMGRLGIELKPQELDEKELEFTKKAIEIYKKIRPVIQLGDLFQIHSPYQEGKWSSCVYVSKNKKEAVFFAFSLDYHLRTITPVFKLKGLDANKKYKITELNHIGQSVFGNNNEVFTGDYLMNVGVNLKLHKRGQSAVFSVNEISD